MLVLCLSAMAVMAQDADKAKEILDKVADKYQKVPAFSAMFEQRMINQAEGLNEKFEGAVLAKGNKFRIDIAGRVIFNDGSTMWTFVPDDEEVTVAEAGGEDGEELDPTAIYTAYKKGFKLKLQKNEKIDGKDYRVIDLLPKKPKDKSFFRIRVYVTPKGSVLHRWSVYEKDGNVFQYTISNFKELASLPDTDFRFDKSKYPDMDIDIVDLR
ncbi:hypothetical protein FUAX_27050 [Fulvitalea axinellae]|uniref:Outer membrane lipoprotein carrier protein LolA n=2 Tax=Fulvitalea axinellae TaxID=1182444 RepID=A0AAU9CJG8_9BACT|nr:hypothetical protein FUAX_27050 [Fulvitalea axinellae]